MNYNDHCNQNSNRNAPLHPESPPSSIIDRLSNTQALLDFTLTVAHEVISKINGDSASIAPSSLKPNAIGLSGDVDTLHNSMCELNDLITTINSRL